MIRITKTNNQIFKHKSIDMKTLILTLYMLLLALCSHYTATAQSGQIRSVIPPSGVSISANKTTNLIFPFAIKSIDRGSREVLAQKAPGVDNILQVKAASAQMQESNLTVITSDGALYSFNVSYSPNPSQFNFTLGTAGQVSPSAAILQNNSDKVAAMQVTARELMSRNVLTDRPNTSFGDIKLSLQGVYTQGELLYFKIAISNASSLKYDLEQLRFFIRDNKQSKRTAVQEIELRPLYAAGNYESIAANSSETLVLAFEKFSIADGKWLGIQLSEKSGGRNLSLKLKNSILIKATIL
jgi:conjugative transposon TraN protein